MIFIVIIFGIIGYYYYSTPTVTVSPTLAATIAPTQAVTMAPTLAATIAPTLAPTQAVTMVPIQSVPTLQNISVCEGDPVQLSCPSGKKLAINKWQYYRPDNTKCGTGYPSCAGLDYTKQANALIVNNQINLTGAAAYYPGFTDPCDGILKQSDIQYSCV
jgi:hypothetical protein